MDQSTTEVRLAKWTKIITECKARPASMSAHQWLIENDIPEKRYYYWQRRIRNEAFKQMQHDADCECTDLSFAEVQLPMTVAPRDSDEKSTSPAAILRCREVTIEISNDISDSLLRILLREVSHA